MSLNICFISSTTDISVGSYRIWVHDLSKYLKEIDIKTSIYKDQNSIHNDTVIIIGKADIKMASYYREEYSNNIIGIAQVINKKDDMLQKFNNNDIEPPNATTSPYFFSVCSII